MAFEIHMNVHVMLMLMLIHIKSFFSKNISSKALDLFVVDLTKLAYTGCHT